jgi:hypothetical protein
MHESVLVVGVSNQDELEKALEPFYQLGCTMGQEESKVDPRSEFSVEYTKEEAEKYYQESIVERPTKEQAKFFRDNFMEVSDEETCQEMYCEKKNTKRAPNGYTGDDFAYGNTKGEDGESFFFFVSEEKMPEARKWVKENKLSFWNVTSPTLKEDFLKKNPDAHTYHSGDMEWSEEEQGFGYYDNPNGFWDWYQVGGRWFGYFTIKKEKRETTQFGEPSLMMQIDPEDAKTIVAERADVLKISDIDFDAMEESGKAATAKQWDDFWAMLNKPYKGEDGVEKTPEERETRFRELMHSPAPETREEYIERNKQFGVSSIVYKGVWYEKPWRKGEPTGGYVAQNKDRDDRITEDLPTFLRNLPPETPLMLVDCHR